jgi:hypothetical protein
MKITSLLAVAATTFISACAGITANDLEGLSPQQQDKIILERMESKSTNTLKDVYRKGTDVKLGIENSRVKALAGLALMKRHGLSRNQFVKGMTGAISVGDNLKTALFAWGCYNETNGSVYYDKNVSAGAGYYHVQYVCGNGNYIYTNNRRTVSSYQT